MIANMLELTGDGRAYFTNDVPLPATVVDRTIPDFESELQAAMRSDLHEERAAHGPTEYAPDIDGQRRSDATEAERIESERIESERVEADRVESDRLEQAEQTERAEQSEQGSEQAEHHLQTARGAATDDDRAADDDGSQIEQLKKEKLASRQAVRDAQAAEAAQGSTQDAELQHAADKAQRARTTHDTNITENVSSAEAAQETLPEVVDVVSAERDEGADATRLVANHAAGRGIGDNGHATESKHIPDDSGQIITDKTIAEGQTEAGKANEQTNGHAAEQARASRSRVEVIDLSSGNDAAANRFSGGGDGDGLSARQATVDGRLVDGRLVDEIREPFMERLQGQLRDTRNTRIVQHARFLLRNNRNDGEIRLLLKPEQLGKVRVQLQLLDSRITGRIIVENSAVRDVFEQNIGNLQREFREQGFESAGIEVAVENGRQNEYEAQQPKAESSLRIAEQVGLAPLLYEIAVNSELIDVYA